MRSTQAIVIGESNDKGEIEQTSAHTKDTTAQQQASIRIVENVRLIWLDNNEDYQNTISQLQHVVNTINTFTNAEECIEFIGNLKIEKACIIIGDSFGEQTVPRIHNMTQVDTIFIFSDDKTQHGQWIKEWSKVKGIFTEISSICDPLKKAARQCEHNATPMSFVGTSDDICNKNLNQLDCSFMYTQLIKEILLNITFEDDYIKQFIQHCCNIYAENQQTLNDVKEFERKYHDKTPIRWYSSSIFLYPMLNRALRVMDADVIIKMGFFLRDLHHQIEQLQKEQYSEHNTNSMLTLYRGQRLSKTDLQHITKIKGGLMSFNNFLSTSKNPDVSHIFAGSNSTDLDTVGIFFVMKIDPSQSTTPFASIKDVSEFFQEDEVLFSMHSIFRIEDIKPIDENQRVFQVNLRLTNDNDKDLRVLTESIRKEIDPECKEWYRLGKLLLKLAQPDKAEQLYEVLLGQAVDDIEKALSYYHIGWAKYDKGEYKEALTFYEKALQLRQQSLPSNHPHLADCYHCIGLVYYRMGDYLRASSYSEKALEIQQQSLPSNHPDLANSYNSIGNVYQSMGDYSKALSSHERALGIRQQSFPPNHPDLAASYNNIGNAYYNMGDYPEALSSFKKDLEITQQSLPPNHPNLAVSYNNIGDIYRNMGQYSKALSSYEKGLEIQQQSLPPYHPDLAVSYNNIGEIYRNMGQYLKALSFYEKALETQQQSLPPNHPALAKSYNNIGNVYDNMGDYWNAVLFHQKALEIRKQSLPPNHPYLANSYNNIGEVYRNMGEYSKALSSNEKALEIQRQSLPLNHPDLAGSYNNIGEVYRNMGNYSEALSFYERAVNIGQQSLSPNHPHLQVYRNNLKIVEKKL